MKGFEKISVTPYLRAIYALDVICGVAKDSTNPTIQALADDARETVMSAREHGFLTHDLLDQYCGDGIEAVAASVFRMHERDEDPCAEVIRKPRYVGAEVDALRRDILLSGSAGDAYDVENSLRARVGSLIVRTFVQIAKIGGRRVIFIDDADAPEGAIRFFVSDFDAETGAITLTRPRNAPGRKSQ